MRSRFGIPGRFSPGPGENCSICLDGLKNPVETNCGHFFCSWCIFTHWRGSSYPEPCQCPLCRGDVTLLKCVVDSGTRANVAAYNQRMNREETPEPDSPLGQMQQSTINCVASFSLVYLILFMVVSRYFITSAVKSSFIPDRNPLPDNNEYLFGRERDIEAIAGFVSGDKRNVLTVYGSMRNDGSTRNDGSALAIHVGHMLGIPAQYIRVNFSDVYGLQEKLGINNHGSVSMWVKETRGDSPDCPPVLQSQSSIPTSCSICLGDLHSPVETNCGHTFCGRCILTHWNHDRHPQPCRCPICRRNVTLLLPCEEYGVGDTEVRTDVAAYNQRMSGEQGGVISQLRDVPVLFQHLRQDMLRLRGGLLPCCSKLYFLALGVAALLYLISPIDLIPEAIFGIFGFADDIVALVLVVVYASAMYRAYVVNQQHEHQT